MSNPVLQVEGNEAPTFQGLVCVMGLAWDTCHFVTKEEEGSLTNRLPRLLGMRESHFSKRRPALGSL